MIISTTISNNQEKLIGDALKSVVDQVDRCLIIDTGITDDTLQVARDIAKDKLHVKSLAWSSDFSAARNVALIQAKVVCAAALGMFQIQDFLEGVFALTLDTDERIQWNGLDLRSYVANLPADIVGAHMRSSDGSYSKERLIRLPTQGVWKGRVHEHFSTFQGNKVWPEIPKARFFELPKSREQYTAKFRRDAESLRISVSEDPLDSRSWYYLGASLHDLHQYAEAEEAFTHSYGLSGWEEEAAWSAYRAAECCVALKKPRQALEWCAKGLTKRADVTELAWLAGWISFQEGNDPQAIRWSYIATDMEIHHRVGHRRIGFTFPLGQKDGPWSVLHHAYARSGMKEEAAQAERLRAAAEATRLGVVYAKKASELFPSFFAKPYQFTAPNGLHAMNPSVTTNEQGELVSIIRCVNYTMDLQGRYTIADPHGIIRTENWLGAQKYPIFSTISDSTDTERSDFPVKGYEDMRLFQYRGEWYASATVRDRRKDGLCQIALCQIQGTTIRDVEVFPPISETRHEKNWVPLVRHLNPELSELCFIYSTFPLAFYHPNHHQLTPATHREEASFLRDERGSSQAVPIGNGDYLYITHRAVLNSGPRRYVHRFVLAHVSDVDLQISYIKSASEPFCFLDHQVEFCAGLALTTTNIHTGPGGLAPVRQLHASFGVRDAEAWLARFDLEDVLRQLKPLEAFAQK